MTQENQKIPGNEAGSEAAQNAKAASVQDEAEELRRAENEAKGVYDEPHEIDFSKKPAAKKDVKAEEAPAETTMRSNARPKRSSRRTSCRTGR